MRHTERGDVPGRPRRYYVSQLPGLPGDLDTTGSGSETDPRVSATVESDAISAVTGNHQVAMSRFSSVDDTRP